jgi:hypothetical protein
MAKNGLIKQLVNGQATTKKVSLTIEVEEADIPFFEKAKKADLLGPFVASLLTSKQSKTNIYALCKEIDSAGLLERKVEKKRRKKQVKSEKNEQ